jgi:hypothetical protein
VIVTSDLVRAKRRAIQEYRDSALYPDGQGWLSDDFQIGFDIGFNKGWEAATELKTNSVGEE